MRAWLRRWLLGGELDELRDCLRDLVEIESTNGYGLPSTYRDRCIALRKRLGMEIRNG